MRLNDEQITQIKDCLVADGCSISPKYLVQFVCAVEASIAEYENAESGSSHREVNQSLARLWKLAQEDDPDDGQIRAAIEQLPRVALEFIERRLSAVLPGVTNFPQWAQSADGPALVVAARKLSAHGASWQPGRSRGPGKRSGPRLQPVIGPTLRGGRPRNASKFSLIAYLAIDWLYATGKEPKPGRGSNTGFGYLVFSVFEWLGAIDVEDESEENSLHVLRQYWEVVEEGRKSSPAD